MISGQWAMRKRAMTLEERSGNVMCVHMYLHARGSFDVNVAAGHSYVIVGVEENKILSIERLPSLRRNTFKDPQLV